MSVFYSTEDPSRYYFSGVLEKQIVSRRVLDLAECGTTLDLESAQCALGEIRLLISTHGSDVRVGQVTKEGIYKEIMVHGGPGSINKIA
jgi:hypothetical protein